MNIFVKILIAICIIDLVIVGVAASLAYRRSLRVKGLSPKRRKTDG